MKSDEQRLYKSDSTRIVVFFFGRRIIPCKIVHSVIKRQCYPIFASVVQLSEVGFSILHVFRSHVYIEFPISISKNVWRKVKKMAVYFYNSSYH